MLYKALDIVGIGIVLGFLMLFGELDEAADLSVVGFLALITPLGGQMIG